MLGDQPWLDEYTMVAADIIMMAGMRAGDMHVLLRCRAGPALQHSSQIAKILLTEQLPHKVPELTLMSMTISW